MIDCAYVSGTASPGIHECALRADDATMKDFKCQDKTVCWAFEINFKDMPPRSFCDVTGMSITINGSLVPVRIEKQPHLWTMFLNDWPTQDAVVHWTIVPCKEGAP